MDIEEVKSGKMDTVPVVDGFATLWRELDSERTARQWTRACLARKVSELSGRAISSKTVHDRMTNGRRVPWSEARWFVRALELDGDLWEKRWVQAGEARRKDDDNSTADSPGPKAATASAARKCEPDSAALSGAGKRFVKLRRPWVAGLACIAVVAVAVGAWTVLNGGEVNPVMGCAVVAGTYAEVFRSPGDPDPLTIKLRGERITFPREMRETAGPDGRKYRMVRTPTRTTFGYAYALSGALKAVPC
jgi:hypothetical protein